MYYVLCFDNYFYYFVETNFKYSLNMKRILIAFIFFFALNANAQVYNKGSKFANLGVGLSPGIGGIASVDVGIHESVSGGVWASYQTWGLLGALNYGRIGVGARGDFHLGDILKKANVSIDTDKIDPYVGGQVGIGIYTGSFGSIYSKNIWPIIGGHIGARYMTKGNMGFFGEVGYDVMYLKAGLTFKLGK
jgi:hypothetical protein